MRMIRVWLWLSVVLVTTGCMHHSGKPDADTQLDLSGEWFWEHPDGRAQMTLYLSRPDRSKAGYSGQFCYVGQQGARINCARQDHLWQRPQEAARENLLFEFINPYDGTLGVFRLQRSKASQIHWQLLSATEWLPLRVDLQRQ